MKKLNTLFLTSMFFVTSILCSATELVNYKVIPLPQEISLTKGTPFILNEKTLIVYPKGNSLLKRNADFLAEYIRESTGYKLSTKEINNKIPQRAIALTIDKTIAEQEGYTLAVTSDGILIKGSTANGIFYGIQTLRKAIPVNAKGQPISMPGVLIKDQPRFSYRGMHLDVGRHFFPVQFIKEYIDLLALHNMNTFHWHLTEDQGWRIEIKKYPKLTEIGSIRERTVVGRNTQEYDNTPHSGFYTQEQAKEIVEYAKKRYITVIPEIDLPGHMLAALTAYPELGCTGGPYKVAQRWGVFDDVLCIGNEKSLTFLEDVLAEIVSIFPSKYIHIGGDEAPRTYWKTCPKCQARIKEENLKADAHHTAEDRLQSYCMARIENYLNSKGRQVIGWDEILEGDVAPNATVMSWRGVEGGIKAAQLGHDVIMTPNTYCYFDYYQTTNTKKEPLAIGGYLPIEKVYNMEPLPAQLTEDEKKHIIGVQANVWTEYIPTTKQVEYMILPRMAALSEVQWTQPDKKDYKDFSKRLMRLMEMYERDSLNYASHIFDIEAKFIPNSSDKAVKIVLSTVDDAPIYYTLDGTSPDTHSLKYNSPLNIVKDTDFRAIAIRKNKKSEEIEKNISFNKATFQPIELITQPSDKYKFNGAGTLVDGLRGNDNFVTGEWLGFTKCNAEAIIDLGKETKISRVFTDALVDMGAWVMGASEIVVSTSPDKIDFKEVATKSFPSETSTSAKKIEKYELLFPETSTRYVRITIKPSKTLPEGHVGEGHTPYLFIDEIGIE